MRIIHATEWLRKGGARWRSRESWCCRRRREEVWEELTDPARLEEWFATEVELDLDEGEGHFRWENGEERHAVVETVEEGRRLGYTWIDEEGRETQVDFTIEEVEEGTRVVVTETAPVAEWGTALELRACALVAA